MAAKMHFVKLVCQSLALNFVCGQSSVTVTTPLTRSTTFRTTTAASTTASPTESPILPQNKDLGPCTCDLTANACDVECCCDPDCSPGDVQVFSQCKDQYNPADSQSCIQSNTIFLSNAPFFINDTVPGLFCIETDNYEERNYYKIPEIIDTAVEFQSYVNKYGKTSYKYMPSESHPYGDFYMVGDPLIVLYESLATGYLALPRKLNREVCTDSNPAGFLENQHEECECHISDLLTQCSTHPMINANTYFKFFKILKSPGLLQKPPSADGNSTHDATTDKLDNLYNSSIAIPVGPSATHICMDTDGLNTTCNFQSIPTPSLLEIGGQLYCQYAIIKVAYLFVYNGTEGIRTAEVKFTFAPLSVDTRQFTQAFTATFNQYNSEAGFQRSGNPGYQLGQPILAGNLIQVEDIIRGQLKAMQVSGDRESRFSIVRSSASGHCLTDPNNRVPIIFGENMRSGCKVKVTFNNMTEACGLIQTAAASALWGSYPPEYVATFGNTPVEALGDWLKIQVLGEPTNPSQSQIPGTCNDMVMGLHIEIVYVNVGALGNPQPKIIGVLYRFSDKENLNFQCVGRYCQPGSEPILEQSFEVVSSVSFIDASKPAIAVDAEKPRFSARLPEDFFYPFK